MKDHQNQLVTIAIPTFNRADRFLKQAIQSAVSQTYQNLEIIVADNCSIDRTEDLVLEFDDPRIIYIKHEKNIGARKNFDFCVNKAKGKYFTLLPDDDLIDEDFVSACISSLNSNYEIGIVFTGVRVIDENLNVSSVTYNKCGGLSTEEFLLTWFDWKVGLYLCNTLYHTEKLREIGGFTKTNYLQDAVADILLAWKFGRADVHDIKASFRVHSKNLGGNPDTLEGWCDDSLYVCDLLQKVPSKNKKLLHEKAIKYFATNNYKLADSNKFLPKRIKMYNMIGQKFNYQYPPWKYVYYSKFKPIGSKFKRNLKTFFGINDT